MNNDIAQFAVLSPVLTEEYTLQSKQHHALYTD
jgi:hypothetical protein